MRDSLGNIVPRKTWDISDYIWEYGRLESENERLRGKCNRLITEIERVYASLKDVEVSMRAITPERINDMTPEPHGAAYEDAD